MKSFYEYLAESAKEYRYRIKAVVPMDNHFIDTLKKALFKYNVIEVSKPKKTPVQTTPLDFRDLDSAEVYMVDITTTVPASSYLLANELLAAFQLPAKLLVVRGENEPIEIEAEAIANPVEFNGDAILDNANYEEADQPAEVAYGDEYNKNLLSYLAQTTANGADEVPAIENVKKMAKFSWLAPDEKTVADDFNADIDTVKPVHSNTKKSGTKAAKPNKTAVHGNYDETVKRKG